MRACENAGGNGGPALDPSSWGLDGGVYYLGTRDHMRRYGYTIDEPLEPPADQLAVEDV